MGSHSDRTGAKARQAEVPAEGTYRQKGRRARLGLPWSFDPRGDRDFSPAARRVSSTPSPGHSRPRTTCGNRHGGSSRESGVCSPARARKLGIQKCWAGLAWSMDIAARPRTATRCRRFLSPHLDTSVLAPFCKVKIRWKPLRFFRPSVIPEIRSRLFITKFRAKRARPWASRWKVRPI